MSIRLAQVVKHLSGREILSGIDLEVAAGELIAVIGENGAGKTTLLRIAAGVLAPDAGSVQLDGSPVDRVEGRRGLGYVPEHPDALPHLAVGELLQLVAALKSSEVLPAPALQRLGLEELLECRLDTLSLGQRRRAFLAAAITGAPRTLVLDEPTNGLDADGIGLLAGLLREQALAGAAVLAATHDTSFVAAIGAKELRLEGGRLSPDPSRATRPPQ